ncbi:MAG: transglutaminase-like domain-containing protein [Candidatus Woesearchaeota archaeon]|jgi:transglutaminase-like putative cysteine protease|nr:transglutaminase-like domain-containing protein [Candidatus Woesearchaeota archaeon]MDP7506514.1 transglutaminase-like domain-containing protein [Candidatus Woesearchaeota archaeon]MDP7610652.1 transglutaminase-like domain-containing protein [Candidatus Woesearchaeota archaeon]|tara:strand:- start:1705 stop:2376 length:672 start_codon:yes stop_codon:yes gene_type:complete
MEPTEPETFEEEKPSWYKGPLKLILSLFLILLIILMAIPYYSIRLDPEPKYVPKISEVLLDQSNINLTNPIKLTNINQLGLLVNPKDPVIKRTSDKTVSLSCTEGKICQAKAIYYFVRDNIQYVSDPLGSEYLEDPKEVLYTGAADCESGSILLSSMLESIGIDTQLVLITGHAYLRAKIPDALGKYKIDDWVYLDWTCKTCEFGEIPWKNIRKQASYLEVGN